ncbi:MAG: 8-oxo-dGTP diphosphatase MutT [Gammaproteobacteria bacterium]|nr:8-oxo-dGTP diphosphatase MutT [Gammaproteobacteria bacterium]
MPNTAPETTVHVAVGVIVDRQGAVLLSLRSADAHQGGLWEFPGGKVESGESVEDALRRELREELGIEVIRSSALLDVHHDYGDKQVHLDVHVVWEFSGQAQGLEDQPLAWVAPQALAGHAFPAANVPIVDAVQQLLNGSAPAGS